MNDSVLTARWVTLVSAVMSANRDSMERPTMLLYVSLLAIFIRVHPLPKMDKLDQLCDTHKIRFKVFWLARLPHVLLHRKKNSYAIFQWSTWPYAYRLVTPRFLLPNHLKMPKNIKLHNSENTEC